MTSGANGFSPLSYQEIMAFAHVEGGVTDDDMRAIRAMSVAFVEWLDKGKDVFQPPPWDGD